MNSRSSAKGKNGTLQQPSALVTGCISETVPGTVSHKQFLEKIIDIEV